ncbi:MAG: hypothetical protein IJI38_00355, partial [Clostridia bacterium]|nr:hypothetical protein [Clostridia bacterium]
EVPAVRVLGMKPEGALRIYRAFTKECMQKSAADGKRLYDHAYALGQRVRKTTGFREQRDLEELVFWLYRQIGIRMSGQIPGDITVSACAFSCAYTPDECRFMSNMDAGIIAGICGKGQLVFTERLTEGCKCCRACFQEEKSV